MDNDMALDDVIRTNLQRSIALDEGLVDELPELRSNAVGWWLKRATCAVPVYQCRYEVPATPAAWAAVQAGGLKVR